VALTRARDRLYLCATMPDGGRFAPAKGSLGRLLPASLTGALATAPGRDDVVWVGPSASHTMRVVPATELEPAVWTGAPAVPMRLEQAFEPLPPDGVPRLSTTVEVSEARVAPAASHADRSSSLLGTLVHRLLAFAQQREVREPAALATVARQFIEGGHEIEDSGDTIDRAVSLSLGVLSRPELLDLPAGAQMVFEAAYSRRTASGAVERGVIDCLLVAGDSVTVLEFKTGSPRAEHRDQLDAYVQAIGGYYRGRRVEGKLIYLGADPPR
jgi:ATP-dependent exoDNAse (exonuclease V) beta subunit